jgi:hypothetical protein
MSAMISISSAVNSVVFFSLGVKSHVPKDGTKLGLNVGLERAKSLLRNKLLDTDAEGVKLGVCISGIKFNVAWNGTICSSLETGSVALKKELSSWVDPFVMTSIILSSLVKLTCCF